MKQGAGPEAEVRWAWLGVLRQERPESEERQDTGGAGGMGPESQRTGPCGPWWALGLFLRRTQQATGGSEQKSDVI